jgi:hypothetical protein
MTTWSHVIPVKGCLEQAPIIQLTHKLSCTPGKGANFVATLDCNAKTVCARRSPCGTRTVDGVPRLLLGLQMH